MLWDLILRQITNLIITLNLLVGNLFDFKEKTTVDFLQQAGYPVEVHEVSTQDGYELTLHRIPYSRFAKERVPTKKPILLMHGLLCNSAQWISTGESSLALQLSNNGYDVWMGNNRGNTYSRKHKSLNPDWNAKDFFTFSYHELGKYDLPAIIDYILQKTGISKMPYLGYSEGTTQFLVMMSERPEYNEKISSMIAWAPVTEMYMINNKLINLLRDAPILEKIISSTHWFEMFQYTKVGNICRGLCKLSDTICSYVFNLIGQSWERMPNKTMKQEILTNFPAGMSARQLFHYVQGARSGVFRPYDFGKAQNLKIYGKLMPDPYDLSKVKCNVSLFYGDADVFVNTNRLLNDVISQLMNANVTTVRIESKFDHLDFIWSKDVQYLTEKTLETLKNADKTKEYSVATSTPDDTTLMSSL